MPRVAPVHLAILPLAALLVSAAVPPARDFLKMENEWRAKRQDSLTKPDGWLAVAGLFWLHDGVMSIGSDPQSDVVLPAGAPRKLGTLRMQKGVVTLEPIPGTGAILNGKPAGRVVTIKPDTDEHPDSVQVGSLLLTVIQRMDRTGIRMRDPNAETRRNFTGCKWFPVSEKWRIRAKWVAYPTPKKIRITNILGMTDEEPSPGYAEFTVAGKTVHLEPVADDDGSLSFMFKDATTGSTTYAQGRFLDTDKPKDGFVTLDFNQAYNPPCAFIAFATCPLPPKQNTLAVAIEAGEKKYGNHPGAGGR
ncbi:MAG TPA: DUF1684 domain-containing protein [Bryobacteraceae bacterium]|nr:DUF1684 domain-containing protein [Bryobacteraceae bacterium]